MAYIGSGLGAQLMMKQESTVGTAVAPDHSYDFESETLQAKKKEVIAQTLRAGNTVDRGAGRFVLQRMASGDLNMIAPTKNFGLLLKHMLGSPVIRPTSLAVGATQQIHTVGSKQGLGLTVQIGKPSLTGTAAEPFTYPGSKITDWELSCAQSDLLKLKLTFDCWDELTSATTPASPALGAWTPPLYTYFTFVEGNILQGGTVTTTTTAAPGTQAAPTGTTGGTAGSTSRYYKVIPYNATGNGTASTETALTTGNATLTASNYDQVSWTTTTGATGYIVLWGTAPGAENQWIDVGNVLTWNNTGQTMTSGSPTQGTAVAVTTSSVTGGTTLAAITSIKVTGKSGLKTDNFFLGSGVTKAEQNQNAFDSYGGNIEAEFYSRAAMYDAYRNDTPLALELKFVGPQIGSTGYYYTLDVLMPQNWLEDGASPQVSGPDVLKQSLPFKTTNNDVDVPLQITYTSSDTAI